MEFKLRALTNIWTGGVERNEKLFHITGLKGSLHWWYEVLIRGLDGYACDPTGNGCSLDLKEFKRLKDIKGEQDALNSLICPACQMFGCTNWGSKFILRIENEDGVIKNQIKRGNPFTLKFKERKNFNDSEQKLINATIKLIVEYGAIGGRTTLKPSEVLCKNCEWYKKHNHIDYGIIAYQGTPLTSLKPEKFDFRLKDNEKDWPDLKNFWFVKGAYINRVEHNTLVKRNSGYPKYYDNSASESGVFTGGYITENGEKVIPNGLKNVVKNRATKSDSESKKIFSFHGLTHCDGEDCVRQDFQPRCFGYGRNPQERDNVKNEIEKILNGKISKDDIKKGEEVRNEL